MQLYTYPLPHQTYIIVNNINKLTFYHNMHTGVLGPRVPNPCQIVPYTLIAHQDQNSAMQVYSVTIIAHVIA